MRHPIKSIDSIRLWLVELRFASGTSIAQIARVLHLANLCRGNKYKIELQINIGFGWRCVCWCNVVTRTSRIGFTLYSPSPSITRLVYLCRGLLGVLFWCVAVAMTVVPHMLHTKNTHAAASGHVRCVRRVLALDASFLSKTHTHTDCNPRTRVFCYRLPQRHVFKQHTNVKRNRWWRDKVCGRAQNTHDLEEKKRKTTTTAPIDSLRPVYLSRCECSRPWWKNWWRFTF